jgi:hypothetical protein
MGKRRKVVNARKFVSDVRSGMSDAELMLAHGLDQKSLEKLWALLVEKGLLDERRPPIENASPQRRAEEAPADVLDSSRGTAADAQVVSKESAGLFSACPQCGASVGMKALICPECGHVLPGQERWERVEQKKTLTERIPPWLLGVVVSAPFALLIFVMFQHVFIPATEKRMEKGRPTVAAPAPAPPVRQVETKSETKKGEAAGGEPADLIEELISQDIILAHSADYRMFTLGEGWNALTSVRKERVLRTLQSRLSERKLTDEFLVIDAAGRLAARASTAGVEILDAASSAEEAAPPDNSTREPETTKPKE